MGRCIVAGGRDFADPALLEEALSNFDKLVGITTLVSGNARGADRLGEVWALDNEVDIKRFVPNWDLGKHAGFLRNSQMAEYADYLVAFWDGKSKGTKHMIDTALEKGLLVKVVRYG
jgi:hypothetical protein